MHPEWWAERVGQLSPGKVDPRVSWLLRVMAPVVHLLFRPTIHGLDNLPDDRPYILVANHSGGGFAESVTLFVLLDATLGDRTRPAATAYPYAFFVWPFSWLIRRLGAIPSSRPHVEATLRDGVPVLVFPGGGMAGPAMVSLAYARHPG